MGLIRERLRVVEKARVEERLTCRHSRSMARAKRRYRGSDSETGTVMGGDGCTWPKRGRHVQMQMGSCLGGHGGEVRVQRKVEDCRGW